MKKTPEEFLKSMGYEAKLLLDEDFSKDLVISLLKMYTTQKQQTTKDTYITSEITGFHHSELYELLVNMDEKGYELVTLRKEPHLSEKFEEVAIFKSKKYD